MLKTQRHEETSTSPEPTDAHPSGLVQIVISHHDIAQENFEDLM